ncbi:unnamed protein product, partial [Cyprideis torosa]
HIVRPPSPRDCRTLPMFLLMLQLQTGIGTRKEKASYVLFVLVGFSFRKDTRASEVRSDFYVFLRECCVGCPMALENFGADSEVWGSNPGETYDFCDNLSEVESQDDGISLQVRPREGQEKMAEDQETLFIPLILTGSQAPLQSSLLKH